MKKTIKIGSRESKLACAQSEIVINLIKERCPQYEPCLITMKTTGDKILDKTLDKVGGKGLFVKELDKALYSREADITVHSLKDVPMEIDEEIPLGAFIKRDYPFDCLVLAKGASEIDFSKPIGSSSSRRSLQFKRLFKDACTEPIRGNVLTRLNKLDEGKYGALILAQAGLMRLGLESRISKVFESGEIVPAAGQGIIAIQTRKGEFEDILNALNDKDSEVCAAAEREFVKSLDGGCFSPMGAYAQIKGNKLSIKGFYADQKKEITKSAEGSLKDYKMLGNVLANKIKEELMK